MPSVILLTLVVLCISSVLTASRCHTANEGPVRIQYNRLVPIYVFPEMKLHSLIISKTEF
jgi:hypothetical protein